MMIQKRRRLSLSVSKTAREGFVTLVGAGPGSAELLTLAGLKAIRDAEVVLYDALLSAELVDLIPSRAKAIYTGKRCGRHALKQEQINALIVSYAEQGRRVVRLKGGDPFIFGRGSEELDALRQAGLPYKVIPGVSALNGVAARCALPLTSRTQANEFRAIQGHHLPEDEEYWRDLARYRGTLVIFRGSNQWRIIAQKLVQAGLAAQTSYAVIETLDHGHGGVHQVTRGTLADVIAAGFTRLSQGPAIIYVGANVALMDEPMNAATSNLVAKTAEGHEHAVAIANFS